MSTTAIEVNPMTREEASPRRDPLPHKVQTSGLVGCSWASDIYLRQEQFGLLEYRSHGCSLAELHLLCANVRVCGYQGKEPYATADHYFTGCCPPTSSRPSVAKAHSVAACILLSQIVVDDQLDQMSVCEFHLCQATLQCCNYNDAQTKRFLKLSCETGSCGL